MPKVYLLESNGARVLATISKEEGESLVDRGVARWVNKRRCWTAQMIPGARSNSKPSPMSRVELNCFLTQTMVVSTAYGTIRI